MKWIRQSRKRSREVESKSKSNEEGGEGEGEGEGEGGEGDNFDMLVVASDPRKKLRCPITGTLFVNPVKKYMK